MKNVLFILLALALTSSTVLAKPKRDPNRPAATPASVTLSRMSCFDSARVELWAMPERYLVFHTPLAVWDTPPANEQAHIRKFMADMLNGDTEVSTNELNKLLSKLTDSAVVPTDDPTAVLTALGWYDVPPSNTTTTAVSTTTTTTAAQQ